VSIAYVGGEVGTFNGTTQLTFPHPAAARLGDALVVVFGHTVNAGAPGAPAGWVARGSIGGAQGKLWTYVYRVPVAPPASHVFTVPGATGELIGVLGAYRSEVPLSATYQLNAAGPGTQTTAAQLIRSHNNWRIAGFFAPSAGAWTPPVGMTERHDRQTAIVAAASLALYDELVPNPGVSEIKSATLAGAAASISVVTKVFPQPAEPVGYLPTDPPGGVGLV
jgi:hypothetical protein